MNVKEKIEAFSKITEKKAEFQKMKLVKEIEEKLQKGYSEKVEEEVQAWNKKIENEKYKLQQYINREKISDEKTAKEKLAEKRKEITEDIMNAVYEMIREYKKTEDYISYLSRGMADVLKNSQKVTFYLSKEDLALSGSLTDKLGRSLVFKEADEDFIGGFKAFLEDKNILIDNTFKTKLSEEKSKFNPFSLLVS